MKASVLSLSCCFGLLCSLVTTASIPRVFERYPITRRDLTSTQVQKELAGQVSNATIIFGPDDGRYKNVTSRWTESSKPHIQVVIEPATESDVPKIIQYCNANSIEFLALNGGHGIASQLGTFNGIQISMWQLNSVTVEPGNESAWFGGGTLVGSVVQTLWDKGFVATTGGCECVGMVGAGLGGGHGRQEGIHGLISDNMLQINLVLADGSTIRVNSTSYSDLLWGMRGAGHNFGIVTSFEMNIYPRGPDTWHYHNYVWTGDKLEALFNALNVFHGDDMTPIDMAYNVGSFLMNTTISTDEPVIFWTFAYRGTAEDAESVLAPFNAIEPAWQQMGDVSYPGVAPAQGYGMADPICQHGISYRTSTAFLQVYNVTAERLLYESFKGRVAQYPTLTAGASVQHEGYATQAVEAGKAADSAYPFREGRHLNLFSVAVPTSDLDQEAIAWAAEVRDQWNAGQPTRPVEAYINYATGDESLEEHYGHESWRIDRLKGLKAQYDPNNRFRFYNPIPV